MTFTKLRVYTHGPLSISALLLTATAEAYLCEHVPLIRQFARCTSHKHLLGFCHLAPALVSSGATAAALHIPHTIDQLSSINWCPAEDVLGGVCCIIT
jgi:hypothetical protein